MEARLSVPATVASLCAVVALLLLAAPAAGAAETVWLCKPGAQPNPCRGSLETTVYAKSGASRVDTPQREEPPKIDCFYVYPTVSEQAGPNTDREIEPAQEAIARVQAARFSQRCRVFAPMYRQLPLVTIAAPPPEDELRAAALVAYRDVRDAFLDYLRNHSRGRGFVLIGHSQGTSMLTRLVRRQIDPFPGIRERLVSAILLGANVAAKKGEPAGGSFRNVPACERRSQTGCVIAFSTYNEPPPDNTRFGRPGNRVGQALDLPSGPGLEVICTNPVSLASNQRRALRTLVRSEPHPGVFGALLIQMYGGLPPSAPTPWLEPQDHYSGSCVHSNGAHVLMIEPLGNARTLNPSPDDTWGLHLADVNIALGQLVDLVRFQTKAYLRRLRS